ncbi:MAG TPA: hypothetical protein VGD40_20855 [Chryseosolibacter sp.]
MTSKFLSHILAFAVIVLCHHRGNAQHLIVSSEIEKNVAGLHYGASLSIESKKKFSVGGFYQCGIRQVEGNVKPTRTFYALQLQFPLLTCDKIAILLNTKTGFVNDDYFLFVPAIMTNIQLSPALGVSIGSGLRMQNASLIGRLYLTL